MIIPTVQCGKFVNKDGGIIRLLKVLLIRVIIIVSLAEAIEFHIVNKRHLAITPKLVTEIIVVTLVPLVINFWHCLYRNNLL